MLNRIGFPDETPCPDCGCMIEGEEDPTGIVYQCTMLDCGSTYTGEDLFPENYPPRSLPVKVQPEQPTGWQPIANAPKDGRKIDLWSSKGFRACNAAWDTVSYSMDGSEDVDGWTCAEGHGSIESAGPFTHWMPVPSAPTDQAC